MFSDDEQDVEFVDGDELSRDGARSHLSRAGEREDMSEEVGEGIAAAAANEAPRTTRATGNRRSGQAQEVDTKAQPSDERRRRRAGLQRGELQGRSTRPLAWG